MQFMVKHGAPVMEETEIISINLLGIRRGERKAGGGNHSVGYHGMKWCKEMDIEQSLLI